MYELLVSGLRIFNEFLTAGIAITAFSLLIYALSFNLRDRVARSFALILLCLVSIFVGDAIGSVSNTPEQLSFWLHFQWPGIIFLPAAYFHLSDAVLATTGRPSRGRRRLMVRLTYIASAFFFITLFIPPLDLTGPLVMIPSPYLQRTWMSWIFAIFYLTIIVISWVNFYRAYQRSVTSASRRRMSYLVTGAVAPSLGSFPYLVFGSGLATSHPFWFWLAVVICNLLISVSLVLMAYAVAFFGVSWPDRVVKRRLFKWLMRGAFTATTTLVVTTVARRAGIVFGFDFTTLAPVIMVASILIIEHLITLAAPIWERWLFYGKDRSNVELLQAMEERLLTSGDLRQFLESVLAAVCDRLQSSQAFIAVFGPEGVDRLVTIGGDHPFEQERLWQDLGENLVGEKIAGDFSALEPVNKDSQKDLFAWGDYWLMPLRSENNSNNGHDGMLGLLGILRSPGKELDKEQFDALGILAERAVIALHDQQRQQQVFSTLEALTPQVEMIQRLRAAARYDGTEVLTTPDLHLEEHKDSVASVSRWVKEALTHYWGGPKLTSSPLIDLQVVQQSMLENEETSVNALRTVLRKAIDQTRPEGERRFTTEWLVYNILEMKFLEGRKVREIAVRLAMSEADLYRKQRVAIEAVANAILDMEKQARQQPTPATEMKSETDLLAKT